VKVGNIIPFVRRKKRMSWLQGVTPRKPKWPIPFAASVGLTMGLGMAASAIFLPSAPRFHSSSGSNAPTHSFGLCFTGGGTNCVVDGDTAWIDGVKIRLADIDAPETHPSRCQREADLGNRATQRLQELLSQGPITLQSVDREQDQFGRRLRIVMRGGQSLGMQLVNEGLARTWTGRREPWC